MALMKANEVPENSVALSEVEATTYAWDLVTDWASFTDTLGGFLTTNGGLVKFATRILAADDDGGWALRYGSVFLGGINALSGILINRHFRQKLKLGTYGYFSSVIPITVMPGILTALFHRHSIATGMLLMKDTCPICYEVRSTVIQLGLGMVYPMVLGPASAMMFAHRYSTYRTPNLQEGPKVILSFLLKITRPFKGTLATLAATQFVASTFITYFEMKNHMTMRRKIIAIEKKILREEGYQT